MKIALRWAASNMVLMLLALALASLAWIVAVEEEDPTREERYPQSIPITLPEPPDGMVVVGEFDQRVQVTVRAPESVWRSLSLDDFTATVDLTDLTTGSYRIPVQVELNKQPARVTLVEPEQITLELEPRLERTVPVKVRIEGEPTLGYIMHPQTVTPRQVTVVGPSTYVTRVVEAFAAISVQDANADIEQELELRLLDEDGQLIPHVTSTPEKVRVRIPIELSGYYRSLAVKVVLQGEISPGYFNSSISIEPPSVTVFGNPDVISALPGFVETEPIDVTGAQADVIVRPALSVPPGVAVVSGQQVEVSISIEPIQSSTTVEVTPGIEGLEPALTATVSPETVQVILSGPLPLLDALKEDDVRVILDLFGLVEGTHQVEPQVIAPEGITAQSVLPPTVQVEISPALTPTATLPAGP